jgi:serine phosphatase RsbU (regulator of sigma subunit)
VTIAGTGTRGSAGARAAGPEPARRRFRLHTGAIIVLVVGLLITATMALGARDLHQDNEKRLLRQRVHEGAAVLESAVPAIQIPLSSAALLAARTGGDAASFRALVRPLTGEDGPFASASLWSLADGEPERVTRLGRGDARPKLLDLPPGRVREILTSAAGSPTMSVIDLLDAPNRRLGYAVGVLNDARFVVYAEAQLPRGRRSNVDDDAAFANVDYALYLGSRRDPEKLLASSTGGELPLRGNLAADTVAFGDDELLIVFEPRGTLGGTFVARLPWLLAVLGVVITLAAAALVEFLSRRREQAELLAAENERIAAENARLLADQRSVAYTLQHSLLPEELPDVDGLQLGVRYVAGVEGVDVGGDWYDVLLLDDDRLFFVVGDVSGRGLRAATVMASLRYAIRAYASQGDGPATVLSKLSRLLNVGRDGNFATVLCGIIDVAGHEATLASAGHPYPLLLANGHADYVAMSNGVPVGVTGADPYHPVIVSIPARATLLVYTDGLVERRGEPLDTGFDRLRASTANANGSLEQLLTRVVDDVTRNGSDDDTAVLGIHWTD